MFKKMKLGLTLIKYGFKPKTNLAMCIIFCIIGLTVEIISKGTNIIGAFYLLLTGMFVYQMVISMDVSTFVQTSKMKKSLQTTVPVLTGTLVYLTIYAIVAVERFLLAMAYPDNAEELAKSTLIIIVMLFGAMIYTGFCYKYFIVATIFMCLLLPNGMMAAEHFWESRVLHFGLTPTVLSGFAVIILGGVLEYLIASLLYKKELSTFAFKGLFGKMW